MSQQDTPPSGKAVLFTIGFAGKTARAFFALLQDSGVRQVLDARLSNHSQLAGFTKHPDFEFFLFHIASIGYKHVLDLAPTKELLNGYRKKTTTWPDYEAQFLELMAKRHIESLFTPLQLDKCCLLCSEPTPSQCHRRLVAEYLQSKHTTLEIHHL